MTRKEIIAALDKFGLDMSRIDSDVLTAFSKYMKERNFGYEETADAYMVFHAGYVAGSHDMLTLNNPTRS